MISLNFFFQQKNDPIAIVHERKSQTEMKNERKIDTTNEKLRMFISSLGYLHKLHCSVILEFFFKSIYKSVDREAGLRDESISTHLYKRYGTKAIVHLMYRF